MVGARKGADRIDRGLRETHLPITQPHIWLAKQKSKWENSGCIHATEATTKNGLAGVVLCVVEKKKLDHGVQHVQCSLSRRNACEARVGCLVDVDEKYQKTTHLFLRLFKEVVLRGRK